MFSKTLLRKLFLVTGLASIVLLLCLAIVYQFFFTAPEKTAGQEVFIVSGTLSEEKLTSRLENEGFIKKAFVLKVLLPIKKVKEVGPGGYRVSKSMNAWDLVGVFAADPDLVWVTVPEGWRKEQIGERLARALNWDDKQLADWVQKYTAMDFDHLEGVYFPDTYLIPKDEDGLAIAKRFQDRFEEKIAPYYDDFLVQNIKWTTGLTLASIIQREAAGDHDMNLIAGILWNRLFDGMRLQVDATVQYVRDDIIHYGLARYNTQPLESYISQGGWWTPIKPEDKNIASPYNTYRNEGLPPHPICNPGLAAIEAVLNPEETDCFYYLHAPDRQIYCAATYQEHLENIDKHLR
ncbi:MAG: endolytic transglycosylase MltG [Candidatus Shapirobacteria bacterium]|nr:endolytic transglycosylase MltG [Candidatus Shapirobacteria bacterium]